MGRRSDIEADHVLDFGGELRVAAELEGAQPVRRQAVGAPDLCTVLIAKPVTLPIARLVQCVVSPGGAPRVSSTTAPTVSAGSGALPGLRVLSRSSPSTPASMKRPASATRTASTRPPGA